MPRTKGGREATVYDAVAERIDYEGFIKPKQDPSYEAPGKARPKNDKRGLPVTPEEVLFRARNAPDRYEEDDIYAAERHLIPGQELPDSDLLKAIHAYVTDFYSRGTIGKGVNDVHSMDESALLACGILLEEACKDILGEHGDMVFAEPDSEKIITHAPAERDYSSSAGDNESHNERGGKGRRF